MPAANNDLCQIIQNRLDTYVAEQANPFNVLRNNGKRGFLDALLSETNSQNRPEITDASFSNTSKDVTLRLRYWQGLARDYASGTITDPCVAGTTVEPLSTDYTISGYSEAKKSHSLNAFRAYCESKNDVMSQYMIQLMFAVEQKMNADLGAELFAVGTLPYASDGTNSVIAPKTLEFFSDFAAKSISPNAEMDLKFEFEDAGIMMPPIVVGQGILRYYAKAAEIACCNDVGVNLDEVGGAGDSFMWYEDRDVGTTLGGANNFFAWAPSMVQMLQQNKFSGDHAQQWNEDELNGTIQNPISGITHDITIRRDICGVGRDVNTTVTISNNYGIWTLPSDAYPAGDPLSGYLGAVQFIAS